MEMFRSVGRRIVNDLKQKSLIPLKMLCFINAGTQLVLYPYLTIHMRELGIHVEETALMAALTPAFLIMVPPLAGMFADKIGNFKLFLAMTSFMGGLSALLLLLVPVGRMTVIYPPNVELITSCNGTTINLQHVTEFECQPAHSNAHGANFTIETCGFMCDLPMELSTEDTDALLDRNSYIINLESSTHTTRLLYQIANYSPRTVYPIKSHDRLLNRNMTNDPFFNSTMSKIGDNKIFFPALQLYSMDCIYEGSNASCTLGQFDLISDLQEIGGYDIIAKVLPHLNVEGDIFAYDIQAILSINGTNFGDGTNGVNNPMCIDKISRPNGVGGISVSAQVGSQRLPQCVSACAATAPRAELCENLEKEIEFDPVLTFWVYMAVRVFIGITGGIAFALFEGAIIAMLREYNADYGLQKVFGSFGGMVSSPLSGMLIDYFSRGKGYTDFRPAFYMYAVLRCLSGVLILTLNLKFKKPAQTLFKDVAVVCKNVEIIALLLACVVMGMAWGYLESFLFWFLQDLGASQSLMGITVTVGGIAALPLLVLSGPIIDKVGHANILFLGFIFYALRLFGYSFIYNPWFSLLFEAMESMTLSLSTTAAVTYAAVLSSATTDASIQGLLGAIYYGVGKGAGSLVGGYLMSYIGTRPTYRLFAAATAFTGCVYFIFNKFYVRNKNRKLKAATLKNPIDVEGVETDLDKDNSSLTVLHTSDLARLEQQNTDGGSDTGFVTLNSADGAPKDIDKRNEVVGKV